MFVLHIQSQHQDLLYINAVWGWEMLCMWTTVCGKYCASVGSEYWQRQILASHVNCSCTPVPFKREGVSSYGNTVFPLYLLVLDEQNTVHVCSLLPYILMLSPLCHVFMGFISSSLKIPCHGCPSWAEVFSACFLKPLLQMVSRHPSDDRLSRHLCSSLVGHELSLLEHLTIFLVQNKNIKNICSKWGFHTSFQGLQFSACSKQQCCSWEPFGGDAIIYKNVECSFSFFFFFS